MNRLVAAHDPSRWVPVTGSLGWRGRRHRRAALRALLSSGPSDTVAPGRGRGMAAWAVSQVVPFVMRRSGGRVLAWVWKDDPELAAVVARIQQWSPMLRIARASAPIEYDDTERFDSPHLGAGEKLRIPPPPGGGPESVSYSWDTGTHLLTVSALGFDRVRFGTVVSAIDDLARSVRVVADHPLEGESPVLRIDPSGG